MNLCGYNKPTTHNTPIDMKPRANKYTYYKVLQSNSGYGWDDEVFYDKSNKEQLKELRDDIKAYRAENIQIRVIERRELS